MNNEKLIQLVKLLDTAGYKVVSIEPEAIGTPETGFALTGNTIVRICPLSGNKQE